MPVSAICGMFSTTWCPEDFGAVGDGVHDDTAAQQAAITAAMAVGGEVRWSAKTYLTTGTLVVAANYVRLYGNGATILFQPSASASAIKVHIDDATDIFYCQVSGFRFKSSNVTLTKTMIEVVKLSVGYVGDIISNDGEWSGANSVGLRIRGHDTTTFERLRIVADIPISIEDNPNSTFDLDLCTFHDLYLVGNDTSSSHPLIKVATGLNLTNIVFSGRQSWNRGGHGLQWLDTNSTQRSAAILIQNVRWEQSSGGGWCIDIEHNFTLDGLRLENVVTGSGAATNGFKFRKVSNITFANCEYDGTTTPLDTNSTVGAIAYENTRFPNLSVSLQPALSETQGPSIPMIQELGLLRLRDSANPLRKLIFGIDNTLGAFGKAYIQAALTGTTTIPLVLGCPVEAMHRIASGVITPTEAILVSGVDVTVGNLIKVTLTAARTVGAPLNPMLGQRLTFTFVQDVTGGRAVSWNSVFKVSWSNTGNVGGKRSSVSFIYDGANWNQDGAQSPWI